MIFFHETHRLLFTSLLALMLLASCKAASVDEIKRDTSMQPEVPVKTDVAFWLTQSDQAVLFRRQNIALNFTSSSTSNSTITVDTTQTYQSIDGFGFALTGGSASLINGLDATHKESLLKELFLTDSTYIGISYLRISIGASDLSAQPFTYDEVASGQRDDNLQAFSMSKEDTDLIPILQKIIVLNPAIRIIATPWTAPTWMKTGNSFEGGSLRTDCYDVYARYFIKYLKAMQDAGITIEAVTPQNEPLNAYNNPAMLMQSNEQSDFIKNYLGPQLKANHLNTKIIIYDHNCDNTSYPLSILADSDARQYVNGSAFHLYSGDISALSVLHQAYPDKDVYFTEQWVGAPGNFSEDLKWHIQTLIIGASRNWSKNVLEWNLASDPNYNPHTLGGCSSCLGALTIGSSITRNVGYYIIAHASKFVRPGSIRIGSNNTDILQDVAFKTPDGHKVLIVLNTGSSATTFNIKFNNKIVSPTLSAGAVGTFVW